MDAPAEPPSEESRPLPDDADFEQIEVVAERPGPDEASYAVTVVPVDDTLPLGSDVAAAVQRAPGVHVQRLGGLGDWSSVSIRGGTVRQVEVFLDGVPLNPEGGAAANLSELPLWAFDQVEIYRGLAPLRLDSAAMGGAVNLVPQAGGSGAVGGALSAGSWGTVRAQVTSEGPVGKGARVFVAADGLATEGDARWYDDGGTRTRTDDDVFRPRENNDTEQLSGLARVSVGDERAGLALSDAWLVRREGVPGTTFAPVDQVRYAVDRHLPALVGFRWMGPTRLEGRVWGVHRSESLEDPVGELGPPRTARTLTQALGARAQVDTAPSEHVVLSGVASVRHDRLDGRGVREVVRAGAEATVTGGGASGSATLRGLGADGEGWVLPRIGARVAGGAWAWRLGGGRGVRIPDLTERYGDRGVLLGNPDLRAESAWTVDTSAVWTPTDRARLEVGAYATDSRDRIVWARNAQGLARPDNVDRARILGLEGATDLRWGPVDLRAAGALVDARDRSADPAYRDHQLPGVPAVELWDRLAVGGPLLGWGWSAAWEVSLTAGTYDDPTNLYRQAPRLLHAANLSARRGPWRISVDVRNLTDRLVEQVPRDPLVDDGLTTPQPLEDFAGLPLVGRTLLLSVALLPPG